MFAFYLLAVATSVPAATPMFPEPQNPLNFHLLPSLSNPRGLHYTSFPFAAGSLWLFQTWGEQTEWWEHKQGLPAGTGIGIGRGHANSAVLSADG